MTSSRGFVHLIVGTNPVNVHVTAVDGSITTYTLTITRHAPTTVLSTDSSLRDLVVQGQVLDPRFAADQLVYTVDVDQAPFITVVATRHTTQPQGSPIGWQT